MPPGAPVGQYHFGDGEDDCDGNGDHDGGHTCEGCIEHSAATSCATCVENMLNIVGIMHCHKCYALICFHLSNIQCSLRFFHALEHIISPNQ